MSGKSDFHTIVIEWRGPVTWEYLEVFDAGGLYILTGKRKYQRRSEVQYIGITEDYLSRRLQRHHKIDQIVNDLECWVGKIYHPSDIGRTPLERAESMLISVVVPPLNERKTIYLPYPTAVISHWFTQEGKPRYNRRGIFKDFPDVISWDGSHGRQGNLKVWDAEYVN